MAKVKKINEQITGRSIIYTFLGKEKLRVGSKQKLKPKTLW